MPVAALSQRRFAAILAADAVGYSRAMSRDEQLALQALINSRELIDPILAAHGGRIFNTAGDSVLAEFPEPAQALRAAVEVQQQLSARAQDAASRPLLAYRIGVHCGQVVARGGDLFGDDINIAARLESLAPQGSVCLSEAVYRSVAGKVDFSFEPLGRRILKNIAEPLALYLVGIGANSNAASVPAASVPPTVVVLPFESPEEGVPLYLREGIADDLVRALSRFHHLRVLARSAAFELEPADPRRAAAEREADYCVRGAIHLAGERLRLRVRLVETGSRRTVFAEDYIRPDAGLADLEDEVVATIVATLVGRIEDDGVRAARSKSPGSLAAHDYLLQGIFEANQTSAAAGMAADQLFRKALEFDERSALALSWHALMQLRLQALSPEPGDLDEVLALAERGLRLDPGEAWSHLVVGQVLMYRGELERAETHHKKAASLNPGDAHIIALRSPLATYLGRPEEGADLARRAMRLNPLHPEWYVTNLGLALYASLQYEEAVRAYLEATSGQIGVLAGLAASRARLGLADEAAGTSRRLLEREPRFSSVRFCAMRPFRLEGDRVHLLEGLRLAGLPD